MVGISRSMSVTSGRYFRNCATACSPSLACATTVMSGCTPTMRAMPSRMRRWSSAQSTRIVGVGIDELLHHHRDRGFDRRATARAADDLEAAADTCRALAHREQTEVVTRVGSGLVVVGHEAPAIIRYAQPNAVV